MRVTVLGSGTSGGVPLLGCKCEVCQSEDSKDKRLRPSIMLEWEGKRVVVDCGPDFREQMMRVDADYLDAIVFTHSHRDHTAGLDDIRSYNFLSKVDMPIYLNELTFKILKRQFEYIFEPNPYPGVPKVDVQIIDRAAFELFGKTWQPISVLHYKMEVYGFRIGDFVYITDANFISEEEKQKIKGCKVLILNALRKEQHISHFTLSEALGLVEELEPEQTYLTHISHQMGKHKDVSKELPENVALAYDGLSFELK